MNFDRFRIYVRARAGTHVRVCACVCSYVCDCVDVSIVFGTGASKCMLVFLLQHAAHLGRVLHLQYVFFKCF